MKNEAYLAGGCFWCLDAAFRMVRGVDQVESGYAGGNTENPSYEEVGTGNTGHAEAIRIVFDNQYIGYKEILEIFFALHDPTTLNKQGNDVGTQYRSAIFYVDDEQKKIAEDILIEVSKIWDDKVVTELVKLDKFYRAEEYHQDYFNKNPESGYCQIIINPKLKKFKDSYTKYLKN
jgi:peptide-methionine (S)-S-oxide reductase